MSMPSKKLLVRQLLSLSKLASLAGEAAHPGISDEVLRCTTMGAAMPLLDKVRDAAEAKYPGIEDQINRLARELVLLQHADDLDRIPLAERPTA